MKNYSIEVEKLEVKFGDIEILKNVSFKVKKGDFVGIIGPNGAGKSTLIKALIGLIPYKGRVVINGKVGYVPQLASFNREFPISVYDFVRVPIRKSENWKSEVDKVLERVGLKGYGKKLVGVLSGGEYQRAALARALVAKPDILILDEPESGVDEMGKARFYELLSELISEQNITILMVSHDIGMIFEKCTNVMCLNKTLHCHGPTTEIDITEVKKIFGEFDLWIRSDNHFEKEHGGHDKNYNYHEHNEHQG
ncbi:MULTISPECIES: metal ABC transporter ATP-binding protein [Fervidobacterium]|uniref:ABC transporter related n=1 Tax=Fervidobacterium nodosum (strain ATCC 35602 / DSM 5306 / Rt17-B1) TaxID=381764 RepID=A7HLC9_FERNB|nr:MULTISPECIES: metal ABC transporter ATP-binding protein [Fervidobacterium]ABS60712.1 ABC transporter related [Fervidobacterium nodosum Rt17-B1]KAF2961655.1 metal ABC transporter ATP-binding protein [Fervidobacterium sp. 2310opik-2]PHJ12235.1 metal ABC transporter ATP-binding protein [Fervidobacterium sp. SC_NGM5_G05]